MNIRKYLALGTALTLSLSLLAGCGGGSGSGDDQIVIYSNADEEAITAMENALNAGGYEGKYIVQTYGTSELGGQAAGRGHQPGGRPGDHEHLLPPERPGAEQYVPAPGL